jgi:hypothetical protein
LDSEGTTTTAITTSDLNSSLKNVAKSAYPTAGASSGVYLPYNVNPTTGVATFTGGGIYGEGDASVQLSTSGSSAQVHTIKRGSTTTAITIDNTLNTTTVAAGGTTITAAKDVTVTGDILYKTPPVTTTQPSPSGLPLFLYVQQPNHRALRRVGCK